MISDEMQKRGQPIPARDSIVANILDIIIVFVPFQISSWEGDYNDPVPSSAFRA